MNKNDRIDLIEILDRIISVTILSYILSRLFRIFPELISMIDWDFLGGIFFISTGFVVIIIWTKSKFYNYLGVLSHELTHAFFALLSGNRIVRIVASEFEGFVEYKGRANWLITLSPYFFPLHTAVLIYLVYLFELEDVWYFKVIIFTSYKFYLLTVSKQFSFLQSDIQKAGIPFAILIVSCFHLIFGFMMIFLIQGNFEQMLNIFLYGQY